MQISYPTSAFLIAFLCSLLSSLSGLIVRYPREPVEEMEGRVLSFKCRLEYKTENCDISAKWWRVESETISEPITDTNRFLITVNETKKDEQRHRDIVLTFKSLSIADRGYYQCNAKCLNSGTVGKGHVLTLNVKADPHKGLKASAWSGKLKTDVTVLVLSIVLFVWYN
uniref:Uncharacterized protein LOC793867 precursor n=1 Tax=Danio rerio TaxID=7955 RepID=Q1MT29_DANRE|nr:uncharacterized protein LOC793867 precursor [Danio rerio]|eukprot:NP_001076361.1 uncharacterized protein LOC793867 precursor [Danio rerio]